MAAALTQSCPTLCDLVDGSPPGPSVQEHWVGLPLPPPGDLPDPGLNPHLTSPALAGGFFTTSATWEAQ